MEAFGTLPHPTEEQSRKLNPYPGHAMVYFFEALRRWKPTPLPPSRVHTECAQSADMAEACGCIARHVGRASKVKRKASRKEEKAGWREIVPVNGSDAGWKKHRFILAFGYGGTLLMLWADHLEDALDEAIDWIADHAPGLLADDEVKEAYDEAIAEGKTKKEAWDASDVDVTRGDNGHYIRSEEWSIAAEDPTREDVLELQRRA